MEISAKRHFFTRDRDFYARFFRLLLFISLQNIITTSVSLADNIMLGRFSENALAGVAQVNQIQFLLQMIVNGAAEGMLVLNAQYWGRRDVDAIKKVIAIALRVCVTAGIIMMLATLIFPRQLMLMLIKDEAVIEEGMKYMQVMSFSYIIFCVSNVLISALRGIDRRSPSSIRCLGVTRYYSHGRGAHANDPREYGEKHAQRRKSPRMPRSARPSYPIPSHTCTMGT